MKITSTTIVILVIALFIVVGISVFWWFNQQATETKRLLSQLNNSQSPSQTMKTNTPPQNNNPETEHVNHTPGNNSQNTPKQTTSSTSKSGNTDQKETADHEFWRDFQKPSDSQLRSTLTARQYEVTQDDGTEPAYKNELWNNTQAGIYVDVVSGEPLFSSRQKYKSGTGWPSFTKPLPGVDIVTKDDYSLGVHRVEVRSQYADSHLGHVFPDGPETREDSGGANPTGLRYCLNSAALEFVPVDQMDDRGYGAYLHLFEQ